MLVTLGEQKILTLNDFADLASDELTGGYDVVKEELELGYLEDFALSKKEADDLIMSARDIAYQDWEMKNGKEKLKLTISGALKKRLMVLNKLNLIEAYCNEKDLQIGGKPNFLEDLNLQKIKCKTVL